MSHRTHAFLLRAMFALCLFIASAGAIAQAPPIAWPTAEWPRATPEEAGMDPKALANFVEFGGNVKMDSLFVTRWGRVVTEAYYAPFQRGMQHRINSSTKALVGALAGIAAGQGVLDANAPMLGFFPGRKIDNLDARKQAITVQHLLNMTSGLDWFEPLSNEVPKSLIAMERSADWQQFILDQPMVKEPGAAFNYNSGDWQLVSAIIARQTGMTARDFAAKNLFAPIGITDFRWRQDPQGVSTGGFGAYLRTPDMARFGLLYLNHGEWNGKQVVPRAWAGKVFDAKVPMFATGGWMYADGWWTLPGRKAYFTVGYNRQLIVVMPQTGVVAAMTGHGIYPLENIVDHLTRAASSSGALPPDAQGSALLQTRIAEAAAGKALFAPAPAPAIAREVSGKTYAFPTNEWGWKELTLRLEGAPALELLVYTSRTSDATQRLTLPLGMDGKFAMGVTPEGPTAVQAGWTDASTLSAVAHVPEEAWVRSYVLRFEGSRVVLDITGIFGGKSRLVGEAR